MTTRRQVIARLVARVETRIILSLAILASLVPHRASGTTDLVFLGLFGVELALRMYLFATAPRAARQGRGRWATEVAPGPRARARSRLGGGFLLALDVVALATFVPWAGLGVTFGGDGLRLLRLLRLLFVVGYWSPLLRDGLRVLGRGDRLRQVALLGLGVALMAFAGATILAHIDVHGIDFNGDGRLDGGDEAFFARLWWSFRQVQDNGNLVGDPGEVAVLILSLGLTLAGILLVSFLIGLATDIVRELVELGKNRPLGWRGHTVVVHVTPGLPRLVAELMAYYDRLFRRARFVVADHAPEAPAALREGELARLRYRQTDARGAGLVEYADVATARRVVVLAKSEAPYPDAHTAATVLHAREANPTAWIVAEILDPASEAAARVAAGRRSVIVPTEKLLGLWAVAAVRHPERMALAFDLLAARGQALDGDPSGGAAEVFTFYFDVDGLDGPGVAWDAGARGWTFAALVEAGLAAEPPVAVLGVAYASADGRPGAPPEDAQLELNTSATGPLGPRPVRAIVGLAEGFAAIETLALRVATSDPTEVLTAEVLTAEVLTGRAPALQAPTLGPVPRRREVRRVLVLGFRPAVAGFLAELLAEHGEVEAVIAMRHEESVQLAEETLTAHAVGSARAFVRLAPDDGPATRSGAAFRAGLRGGQVRLVQADWTGERALTGLEAGLGHVASYDLVALLGAHQAEYDGRTAMAVLRIADLIRRTPERFASDFTVLAGVSDEDLGRRLGEGFARASGRRLGVIVTEELRALFVFQAIAVPGYERIATELLNAGFARREVLAPGGPATWTFQTLTRALRPEGLLVVAVELTAEGTTGATAAAGSVPKTTRMAAPGAGLAGAQASFDARRLAAVWVVGGPRA